MLSDANRAFVLFMDRESEYSDDEYFKKENLPTLNCNIRQGNYYALDYVGIPIRRAFCGKKGAFGWKRHGQLYLHWTVDSAWIESKSKDEIRELCETLHPDTFATKDMKSALARAARDANRGG